MKQEELAAKVGVRRETISNLEKGKYNPSLVLAWNIAKVFNVPIEKIFTVENWGDIHAWLLFTAWEPLISRSESWIVLSNNHALQIIPIFHIQWF